MDAERVFELLLDETDHWEDIEICSLFAEHLRENGYYVAEDDDVLRDLALEETDLVEPDGTTS